MFSPSKIREAVVGLIGIRQPYNTEYQVFDADSLASSSGLYLDDLPLFKAEYFVDSVSGDGATASDVNTLLKDIIGASAVSVCSSVFNTSDLVSRTVLYSHATNLVNEETTIKDGFVGLKLSLDNLKDRGFKLNRVFLTMKGVGSVKIMLFNTNQLEPVETKDVTLDGTKLTYIEDLNWNIDNSAYYQGDWYLGYLYDGTLKPYKRDYESSSVMNEVKELDVEKVFVADHSTETLFNLDLEEHLGEDTGLNIDVSVFVDNTSFILNNLQLFSRTIQLQSGINILQRFVSTNRSNLNQRYATELFSTILATVNGVRGDTGINQKGLKYELSSEVKHIKSEIEKIRTSQNGGNNIMVSTLS
jgi:hypothetical protein